MRRLYATGGPWEFKRGTDKVGSVRLEGSEHFFAILMFAFSLQVIRHWHVLDDVARAQRVFALLIFIGLWVQLRREKVSGVCLALASFAFFAALGLTGRIP
jgi:hypothetical protein